MIPRLLERYNNEIVPQMLKKFSYKSRMAVPRLKKIVINMGVGEAIQDIKNLDRSMEELTLISGQKPQIRRAKKAISNFKIRKNLPIGCKVTLRKYRMYEFLDRLLNVALPRIRDFRGVSADAFDAAGNYTLGLKDQLLFPEIDYDKVARPQGMDINFVLEAHSKDEARELLRLFGMPFQNRE